MTSWQKLIGLLGFNTMKDQWLKPQRKVSLLVSGQWSFV